MTSTETQPPAAAANRALILVVVDGDAAAEACREVLADRSSSTDDRARAEAVLALVDLREGRVEAAQRHLDEARRRLAPGHPFAPSRLLVDHVEAHRLRAAGDVAEAVGLLRRVHALATDRPLVDAYLTARALGIAVSLRAEDDEALELFHQALSLARRSGHLALVVNALNNLGSFLSDLHNLEDAVPMLEECLATALRLGHRRQIVFAAGNLTQCLCFMGRPAEALTVARRHLIPLITPDDPPALRRDEEIARALLDNGLVDEAAAVLGSDAVDDGLGQEQLTGRVCLLARVMLHRGQVAGALALAQNRQADLASESTPTTTAAFDQVDLHRITARAAAALGRHDVAYRELEAAWTVNEVRLGRAARSRRLNLQIVHRLREAEWERDVARRQALEDPLTGLANRRCLDEQGAELVASSLAHGRPLAAAVLDLDHFKQVNDRYGHEAGDRVLQAVSRWLRLGLRAGDLAARNGGEEFVVLLPDTRADGAAALIERVLAELRRMEHVADEERFSCTFSAGVAEIEPGDTLTRLLARADGLLYRAKRAGRNRVEASPAGPCP